MSAPLNYPPEIMDAVAAMQRAAQYLTGQMDDLERLVQTLVGDSKTQATEAFREVQQIWRSSGLQHNETLNAVAKAAGSSYDEITSFDAYLAAQLR